MASEYPTYAPHQESSFDFRSHSKSSSVVNPPPPGFHGHWKIAMPSSAGSQHNLENTNRTMVNESKCSTGGASKKGPFFEWNLDAPYLSCEPAQLLSCWLAARCAREPFLIALYRKLEWEKYVALNVESRSPLEERRSLGEMHLVKEQESTLALIDVVQTGDQRKRVSVSNADAWKACVMVYYVHPSYPRPFFLTRRGPFQELSLSLLSLSLSPLEMELLSLFFSLPIQLLSLVSPVCMYVCIF